MGIALRHIGIVVSNLDKAIDIFTNYFGCSIVNKYPEVAGDYISELVGIDKVEMKIAIFKTKDDNRIEILEYVSEPGSKRKPVRSNDVGVSHFAMTVEDIGKLYQNRNGYDVRFLSAPLISPNGYVLVAYAVVMDEFMIELVQVLDEKATYTN
jgi:catechol 2,3-dioxygenase-like lactoylglutathione lyase family enzyme